MLCTVVRTPRLLLWFFPILTITTSRRVSAVSILLLIVVVSILKLKCADSENNRIKIFSKHIIISHFTDIMNASTCYSSSIVYLIILHSLFILLNSSRPIATTSISDQKHSLQVRIYEYCNTIWSPIQVDKYTNTCLQKILTRKVELWIFSLVSLVKKTTKQLFQLKFQCRK